MLMVERKGPKGPPPMPKEEQSYFLCGNCLLWSNVAKHHTEEGTCSECTKEGRGNYVTDQEVAEADKLGDEKETGLSWTGGLPAFNTAYTHAVCPTCGSNVIDRTKKEFFGKNRARYKCRNCMRILRLGDDCPVGVGDQVKTVEDLVVWLNTHDAILEVGDTLKHHMFSIEEEAELTLCENIAGQHRHYLFFMCKKTNEIVGKTLRITNIHHSSLIGVSKVVIDKMLCRSFTSSTTCRWPIRI